MKAVQNLCRVVLFLLFALTPCRASASGKIAAAFPDAAQIDRGFTSRLHGKRASCENSASDRSCWGDYDITTNYYDEAPDTGVTREYYFNLEDTTVSPDGVSRYAQTINGSIPGPTIFADWGDTVTVHLTNSLSSSTNGTGLHFHGIRQNYTNQMDGVPSITQCPIAPGETYTYTWKAVQYGSSWYHSHWALQAWEGMFGGIVINGPATANYDDDLGVLFLNDWDHETADALYTSAETSGPPTLDNGLINGTNVYEDGGSRFETTFSSGTSYRLRVVNAAIDTHWKFAIDNHTFTVIAVDFVPIEPFNTDYISIGMGQRYDLVVSADQTADDYWMRAIPQATCSDNDSSDNIRGIVRYDASSTDDPTSTASSSLDDDDCDDMSMSDLVPYVALDASDSFSVNSDLDVTVGINSANLFKWYLNSTTFLMEWNDPSLLQIYDNDTSAFSNATYDGYVMLPDADVWTALIIETSNAVPHPIHLHGHDFYVLGQGSGSFNSSESLTTTNPPRRDVAMLPSSGYLVIAWQTDNPGAWLAHCHIGWHTEEGFALQFIERQDEIVDLIDRNVLTDTCTAWSTWAGDESIVQEDSGV